ncbi:MAG: anaerobic ribonucleoside-triphosphate reductase activating protein [bacterium]
MIIGGIEKLTLLDYPGKLAAIIFTQGCNFRCQYCYNPMLVWPIEDGRLKYQRDHSQIIESDLFVFLESRRGKLDGVVISGGEPTLHRDLPVFIKKIKDLGFAIKLDTNGTNSVMLKDLLSQNLLDYVAMDIKAPFAKYEQVTAVTVDLKNIEESIAIIKKSGLPYEFRTTLVPGLHDLEAVEQMGQLIIGADKWYLQFFKSDTDLVSRGLENKPRFTHAEMTAMATVGQKYAKLCVVRG